MSQTSQGQRQGRRLYRRRLCCLSLTLWKLGVALVEGRGSVPLWVKNELRYLDTYLTPCEAEQPIPVQWFRIAEDGYNGADEGELWWKGNIYAEDLPSERLRKKPVVRL